MTFDFPENDIRMSNYVTDRMEEIAKALKPREYIVSRRTKPLQHCAIPKYPQYWRCNHGRRSENQCGQQISSELGRADVFVVGPLPRFRQKRWLQSDGDRWERWRFGQRKQSSPKYLKSPGPLVPL